MYTLAIDTASSDTTIAVIQNQKIVSSASWPARNREAQTLLPEIDSQLSSLNLKYDDISNIFVIKGPGSFTGLRVGVTVANTMAYLLNIPLYSISTLDLWHANSSLPILVFAGKLAVYLSESDQPVEIIPLKEINLKLKSLAITKYAGDISDEQISFIEAYYQQLDIGPEQRLLTAFKKYSNIIEPEKIVKPLYIKDPAISTSKKSIL